MRAFYENWYVQGVAVMRHLERRVEAPHAPRHSRFEEPLLSCTRTPWLTSPVCFIEVPSASFATLAELKYTVTSFESGFGWKASLFVVFIRLWLITAIRQTDILLGQHFWLESYMLKFCNKLTFNLHKMNVSFF